MCCATLGDFDEQKTGRLGSVSFHKGDLYFHSLSNAMVVACSRFSTFGVRSESRVAEKGKPSTIEGPERLWTRGPANNPWREITEHRGVGFIIYSIEERGTTSGRIMLIIWDCKLRTNSDPDRDRKTDR